MQKKESIGHSLKTLNIFRGILPAQNSTGSKAHKHSCELFKVRLNQERLDYVGISPPILPGFQEALGKCANSPCLPNMLAHTAAYLEMECTPQSICHSPCSRVLIKRKLKCESGKDQASR